MRGTEAVALPTPCVAVVPVQKPWHVVQTEIEPSFDSRVRHEGRGRLRDEKGKADKKQTHARDAVEDLGRSARLHDDNRVEKIHDGVNYVTLYGDSKVEQDHSPNQCERSPEHGDQLSLEQIVQVQDSVEVITCTWKGILVCERLTVVKKLTNFVAVDVRPLDLILEFFPQRPTGLRASSIDFDVNFCERDFATVLGAPSIPVVCVF
eukprot:3187159-Rhodomonas_salina.2